MLRRIAITDARRQLYEEAAEESIYGCRKKARKKEHLADETLDLEDADVVEWEDGQG